MLELINHSPWQAGLFPGPDDKTQTLIVKAGFTVHATGKVSPSPFILPIVTTHRHPENAYAPDERMPYKKAHEWYTLDSQKTHIDFQLANNKSSLCYAEIFKKLKNLMLSLFKSPLDDTPAPKNGFQAAFNAQSLAFKIEDIIRIIIDKQLYLDFSIKPLCFFIGKKALFKKYWLTWDTIIFNLQNKAIYVLGRKILPSNPFSHQKNIVLIKNTSCST